MARRSSLLPTGIIFPSTVWDPESKELWHYNFEKELVNDEKWSCLVAAAIPAEVQDEESIQAYTQCIKTGLRKSVKTISMADVTKMLKESHSMISHKKEDKNSKPEKQERKNLKSSSPRPSQIIELATKYAIILDSECKLPPDLMAAVLKYMILNLKDENCFQKKVDTVRQKKIREQNIKMNFIRELKPYEMSQDERKSYRKLSTNILESEEPINDEIVGGPDLYIMLTDFYDPLIFPELLRMKVPFLAFLKITSIKTKDKRHTSSVSLPKSDTLNKKKLLIFSFWEKLKEERFTAENVDRFKDIAVLQYTAPGKPSDPNSNYFRIIFDEMTWMLYSVYRIYKQHQKYVKELSVQRIITALEPLDLSKCEMYNKLCDALVTGEPLTPLLVLYAVVEQVVAGVPETESAALEYEPRLHNFFPTRSESDSPNLAIKLVTPCRTCRDKTYENVCEKLKSSCSDNFSLQKGEWSEPSEKSSTSSQIQIEANSPEMSEKLGKTDSSESIISEFLIDQVMSEKKTEREARKGKNYKTPSLCFYGDSVFLQTYFCDSRLLDSKSIFDRFFRKLELPQIWRKYPELSLGERVLNNFHFFSLWKMSGENEDALKLKICFAMLMKLIGITKSYLFKGEEDSLSETMSIATREKMKFPRVKFEKNASIIHRESNENFEKFFLKTFIDKFSHPKIGKKFKKFENLDHPKKIISTKLDSQILHKAKAQFSMTKEKLNDITKCFSDCSYQEDNEEDLSCPNKNNGKNSQKILKILHSLLDSLEISNLLEHPFITDKDDYTSLIQDFKYYEKLKPNLMIQRLVEAQDSFNTVQCSYFSPTDTTLVMMHNDFDHRGIFYLKKYGALSTPVTLRDFYSYVYSEINEWLANENADHLKFVSEIQEKLKTEQEKKDLKYLAQLKKQYCEMSEEKRKEFLENKIGVQSEPEISEKELGDLPEKLKFHDSYKMSFLATNLTDVRVQSNQKMYEFHSSDGTEVNVSVESWLNSALSFLNLKIKKSKLVLHLSQCLGEEKINSSFALKTKSDMIFSFSQDDFEKKEDFSYGVKISWPTGLLIEPIFLNSSIYIRQSYLKSYRRGWDIEEENSRCFLRNGQVIIFKESGSYDILCGTGTKYIFYEMAAVPKYDIISTTGEIWEIRTRGPCKNKRKLIGTNKIFIGVDSKSHETFYKREDGVCFMLWPNGSLVTNYPDGTKITSTPCFEKKEVTVEWTDEEKLFFEDFESKHKSEISFQDRRSRTILRNSSAPKSIERKSFLNEGFISVSCAYLMEHPKYSSIYFSPEDSCIQMTMPEQLNISIYPEGRYEIHQERDSLEVQSDKIEFYTICYDCKNRSTATINFNSDEVLCKCIDFFRKAFFVLRDGSTKYVENYIEADEEGDDEDFFKIKSSPIQSTCPTGHNKKSSLAQRCFAFGRDLSGVEFIHADSFGCYCYQLPEETYFDIYTDDPVNCTYTFTSPYCKIGYEKWVMDYENDENSRPTNLKKKDLKELGTKDMPKNLFQHPFPQQNADRQQSEKVKRNFDMPKVIVGRTIHCLSQEPESVLKELQKYIAAYQKRAQDIYEEFKARKPADDRWKDSRYVEMRLRKIAVTLNQSLHMYPHLCTQLPSTEKDIHYFGHFINNMEGLKSHFQNRKAILPDCKQIAQPLPRLTGFDCIQEENESLCDP